jgi:hypothetical protein
LSRGVATVGVFDGPHLECKIGKASIAGDPPGIETYAAICKLGEDMMIGTLTFDVSAVADRIKVRLPERENWMTLYACK